MSAREDLRAKRRRSRRQHENELRRVAAHERAAAASVFSHDAHGEPRVNLDAAKRAVREAVRRSGFDASGLDFESARVLSVELPLSFDVERPREPVRLRVSLEIGERWDPRYAVLSIRNFRGWQLEAIDVHDRYRDRFGVIGGHP